MEKSTNRQIVEKWQEIIDNKSFDDLVSVEADDIENINPGGTFTGLVSHRKMLETFATAFPDYIHANYNFIETGDWIAMEGHFSGIHSGPLAMGNSILPPTNNKIEFPYSGFIKIENGKVRINKLYYDSKLFSDQLNAR
jgi:predicted ester cyclase